jgi:hypothetical protein
VRLYFGSGHGTMKKIYFYPRDAIQKNNGCLFRMYGILFGEKRSRLGPEDQRLFCTRRLGALKRFLQDQRRTIKKTRGGRCPFFGKGGLTVRIRIPCTAVKLGGKVMMMMMMMMLMMMVVVKVWRIREESVNFLSVCEKKPECAI